MTKFSDFKYDIQVKEHHLDSFGHMNNATYLELYEEARWQFITDGGYGYSEVQKFKKGPVILDAHVRFSKEICLRETISIRTKTTNIRGKIMYLEQEMINSNDEVASVAKFTIGFMDLETRSLIDPTPEWLTAIGAE